MPKQMVRTTLTLPAELLSAVDDAVREGRARNRGELISAAVRHELAVRDRSAIDRAFAAMSDDETYLKEAEELTLESTLAGWEAFREGEQQHTDQA
jgi:metal-responsive CopG/Arc/MetJ family transcriptional regulator